MKKSLTISAIIALALTGCTSPERVESSAPVLLGDVSNVKAYADDMAELVTEENSTEFIGQFETLMNSEVEGVQGTPAQTVLSTPGLEEFFQDYSEVTEYSVDFERNLFACYVDNDIENVELCIQDLYSSTYDN